MTVESARSLWHVAYAIKHVIHMALPKTVSHLPLFIMTAGWGLLHGDLTMKNAVITAGTGTGIQATGIPVIPGLISWI